MGNLRSELGSALDELTRQGRRRVVRALDAAPGPRSILDGREVLLFGSNDYLGLAAHPAVRAAAAAAVQEWGTGAGASRLMAGALPPHDQLEAGLARLKGAEAALLFSSGYHAGVGTIPALAGPGDLILSDERNHACLIDGCRLSRAEVRVFRHADPRHAREQLADRARFRRALIVTEGVFSMDGDLAPLPSLCDLADDHDAWLMVDDAHGTGVLGESGGGTVEHFGLQGRVPVQMGTLSKALASTGGFVAGPRELVEWLVNRARAFVYTTALAPASAAAASAALGVIAAEPGRRRTLVERAARLRGGLRDLGLDVQPGETPVIPVIAGGDFEALALSSALERRGVWVPAIRPPSVPEGRARLRLSVMATHEDADVDQALAAFAAVRGSSPAPAGTRDGSG